jgi:hypothetical protein
MVKSEQNSAVGAEEVDASSRDPQMFGDGMVGSSSDMNQGTTAGGKRTGRGQSPRSSKEAGNDRGAKGGRDVVWAALEQTSPKGPGSAARLFARMRRNTGLECSGPVRSGPPLTEVSGAKACAADTDTSLTWNRVPKPGHRQPRTGKPDAGKPPVRFGWGATE